MKTMKLTFEEDCWKYVGMNIFKLASFFIGQCNGFPISKVNAMVPDIEH